MIIGTSKNKLNAISIFYSILFLLQSSCTTKHFSQKNISFVLTTVYKTECKSISGEIFRVMKEYPRFGENDKIIEQFFTRIIHKANKVQVLNGELELLFMIDKYGEPCLQKIRASQLPQYLYQAIIEEVSLMPNWEPGHYYSKTVDALVKLIVRINNSNISVSQEK